MRPAHTRAALLLICTALLTLVAPAQDKKPLAIPAKDFKGATAFKVLRAIDGDTIEVEQEGKPVKVRLIGVDTPQTVHPSKPVEAFGKEASKFTADLLKGKSVYLEFDKDKVDRYDRTLAFVYCAPDGLFVNLEIIRQGYGHAYTKYPFKDEMMTLFRADEKEAREAKRGLWADDKPVDGKDSEPEKKVEAPAPKAEVFITKSGTKYHADGCRFLMKSRIPCTLTEVKEKKFEPCSVCNPPK